MTVRDEPHHVEARARLPVSNETIPVWLGQRGEHSVGWTSVRPEPFATKAEAEAHLADHRQRDFEWRLVKGSERVVPAKAGFRRDPDLRSWAEPEPRAVVADLVLRAPDGAVRHVPVRSPPNPHETTRLYDRRCG